MEGKTRYVALATKVIAVVVEGTNNDWSAYIGAVAGRCHAEEWQEVARHGAKLPESVAKALFPDFDSLEWRD